MGRGVDPEVENQEPSPDFETAKTIPRHRLISIGGRPVLTDLRTTTRTEIIFASARTSKTESEPIMFAFVTL